MNLGCHIGVHVPEGLRGQWGSGRTDGPQRTEIPVDHRTKTLFGTCVEVLRADAEEADLLLLGDAPEMVGFRVERRTVVQDDRDPGCQRRHQPVPHHPATGREPEHAIARPHVQVPPVLTGVLEKQARGSMDETLRRPSGPRRVQDEPGGVEGHLHELQGIDAGRQDVAQVPRADVHLGLCVVVELVDQPDLLHRRQPSDDLGQRLGAVVVLPAVDVAVGRDEHLGRHLAEPVEHSRRAEVRARRREDRSETLRREHDDDRLRGVRHPRRHDVSGADPSLDQPPTGRRGGVAEFGPGPHPAYPVLAPEDQGGVLRSRKVATGQEVLRVVQPGCREEAGRTQVMSGRRRHHCRTIAPVPDHLALPPHQIPEVPGRRDREVVEISRGGHRQIGDLLDLPHHTVEGGSAHGSRIRLPQRPAHVPLTDRAGNHRLRRRRRGQRL